MREPNDPLETPGRQLRSGRRFTPEEIELVQERQRLEREYRNILRPRATKKKSEDVLADLSRTDDNNISSEESIHSTHSSDSDSDYRQFSTPLRDTTLVPPDFHDIPSPPGNSIDILDRSTLYRHLRRNLLQNTTMADPNGNDPNNVHPSAPNPNLDQRHLDLFPDTAFYIAIPGFSGNVKELHHFIACCDYFFETLHEQNQEIFFLALV